MFAFTTQYFISSDLCWKTTTTTRCFVLSSPSHPTSISSSLCQYLVLILIQVDCTVIFYVWKFKFTFFSLSLDYTYYLTYVFVAKWWCEDNTVHDVVVLWLMINLVPEFDFQKQKKRFEKNTWLVTKWKQNIAVRFLLTISMVTGWLDNRKAYIQMCHKTDRSLKFNFLD